MADSKKKRKKKRKNRKQNTWMQLLMIAVPVIMLILVVVAVIRLVVWNKGQDVVIDPNEDVSKYETEALDYIQPLDPELLAGHEDDGELTILLLGNDPLIEEGKEGTLGDVLANTCDAAVINCAFPGSNISMKNSQFSEEYPLDALSLYMVAASYTGGNYDLMDYVVENRITEGQDICRRSLQNLKSLDPKKVDMIVYLYGACDYLNERPVMDVNNDINFLTWNGCLNASIQLFQQEFPYIRQVVLTPYYGVYKEDQKKIDMDTEDMGNGVLPDYVLNEIDVAMGNGVSVLDNYYGTINEITAEKYLSDGFHLNKAGKQAIADRFKEEILR